MMTIQPRHAHVVIFRLTVELKFEFYFFLYSKLMKTDQLTLLTFNNKYVKIIVLRGHWHA